MSASARPFPPYEPEPSGPAAPVPAPGEKSPVKPVVGAFFVGLLLTILPIRRILGGITSLALLFLRPVLLILGVVKLYEEVEERRK